MNPLFILGGAIFGVGLLSTLLPDRAEKFALWGGAAIAAAGLFVSLPPVKFSRSKKSK